MALGLILAVVALLTIGCCTGVFWFARKTVMPTQFPAATEDHAVARKNFQTKLIKKGPAPQDFVTPVAPDDVDEVEFTSGALTLRAWITAHPGEMRVRKPAVLFLHGGFAFDESDWDAAEPFAKAGFVVMVPQLRGENGQPGDYSMFFDEVDDVLAAAKFLAQQPHVDPNRIYVAGHSVGGTLAMLAAMSSPMFKGCASFSGSPDQPKWADGQPAEFVPFDPEDTEEFRLRSPLAFPGSFKCPARLYYGDDEFFFKFSTDELAEKARAAGRDVVAEEVPGDHTDMLESAIPRAIQFFNRK